MTHPSQSPSHPPTPLSGGGGGNQPLPGLQPSGRPGAQEPAPATPPAEEGGERHLHPMDADFGERVLEVIGDDPAAVPDGEAAEPSAPAPGFDPGAHLSPRHQLEAWMSAMVELGASDLILRSGGRPSCRVDGKIRFLEGRVPGAGALHEVLEGVVGKRSMEGFAETGSVDTALALDGLGRFRLNAYKQMGEPAVVLRRIAEEPPALESLDLPATELRRIALRKRGMILVTGIAGSGKSTTLAAIIEHMNQHTERHIVTLEDPCEIIFREERCVISQREVGVDCNSFHDGLRHALRQSPDVILIGEMRDAETVSAALDAAETGHLILSTLHTVNAAQTLDRVLGFFPAEQHAQICTRLADNLAAVLSQRLMPRSTGSGMVPACELLTSTPRVRELLEEGRTIELSRAIEGGQEQGLISFNQSLRALVEGNLVELEVALAASDRPDELLLALRGYTPGGTGGQLRMSGQTIS